MMLEIGRRKKKRKGKKKKKKGKEKREKEMIEQAAFLQPPDHHPGITSTTMAHVTPVSLSFAAPVPIPTMRAMDVEAVVVLPAKISASKRTLITLAVATLTVLSFIALLSLASLVVSIIVAARG